LSNIIVVNTGHSGSKETKFGLKPGYCNRIRVTGSFFWWRKHRKNILKKIPKFGEASPTGNVDLLQGFR